MQWIAPAEKDTNNAALEKRLWDAADQFRAYSGQDKWARQQPPFGLATQARRVKNGEGSDPFRTAGTAGTKSRQRGERWSQPHVRQQPKQSNATTRRLAVMNLALRGIEADFGPEHADTFRRDLHPDLRADFVIANPPFNDSDWFRKDDDVRWQFGVPPKGNANFAWVQHFIHHLSPNGMAGFVLANGSMSSNQSGEGEIRKALIEADLVDCMVALPGQLFYSTQIPVCLWFLTKSKGAKITKVADGDLPNCIRDHRKETLFIDARKMGSMVSRVNRELTQGDIEKIVDTYHSWKSDTDALLTEAEKAGIVLDMTIPAYVDIPGFCKSATTAEIAAHGHVLTPGRYVGAEEVEDDGDPFEEKMPRLVAELHAQFAESAKLEAAIRTNLKGLGYAL
jgi:type I restriction enzyme M protein